MTEGWGTVRGVGYIMKEPGRSGQQSGTNRVQLGASLCGRGGMGSSQKGMGLSICLLSNCTWDQHLGRKDLSSSQGQRSTGLDLGVHEAPMAVLETSCGSFRGNDVKACGCTPLLLADVGLLVVGGAVMAELGLWGSESLRLLPPGPVLSVALGLWS